MMRDKRRILNETANVPALGALKFASIMSALRARVTATKLERAKQQFPEDSPRVERLRRRKERMEKSADVLGRRHAAAVEAVAYEVRRRSGRGEEEAPGGPEQPPGQPGGPGHGEGDGGPSGPPGGGPNGPPGGPTTGEGASSAGTSGADTTPAGSSASSGEGSPDASTAETADTEGEEGGTSPSRRARKTSKRKDH